MKYLLVLMCFCFIGCESKQEESKLDQCIKGCKAMGKQLESFTQEGFNSFCKCGDKLPCGESK